MMHHGLEIHRLVRGYLRPLASVVVGPQDGSALANSHQEPSSIDCEISQICIARYCCTLPAHAVP